MPLSPHAQLAEEHPLQLSCDQIPAIPANRAAAEHHGKNSASAHAQGERSPQSPAWNKALGAGPDGRGTPSNLLVRVLPARRCQAGWLLRVREAFGASTRRLL